MATRQPWGFFLSLHCSLCVEPLGAQIPPISTPHPPDTGYGTIYTSDDRGVVFSKSLERHLYTTTGGETDFTNVTSLRGIYITSVLSEGGGRGGALGWGCWAGMRCQPPLCPPCSPQTTPSNPSSRLIEVGSGCRCGSPRTRRATRRPAARRRWLCPVSPSRDACPHPHPLCAPPWMGLGCKPSAVGGGCGSGGALGWRGAEP